MPIKLIGTIILLILATIFAYANLENKCDINFIFYTFKAVPVFMTVVISFAIGAALIFPFTFGRRKKKAQKIAPAKNQNQTQSAKEESKTIFDFKIKREAKPGEPKSEKPKKDKKPFFGFGKKKGGAPSASLTNSGAAEPAPSETHDDVNTGAPV